MRRLQRGSLAFVLAVLPAAAMSDDAPPPTCTTIHEEHGQASWYGRLRHGKRTADGQRMDREALTAAHRHLPLGTRIKVTNLTNGQSVELTVNDRGPYVRGRIVDVSQRAARELGFAQSGTAQVRLEALGC